MEWATEAICNQTDPDGFYPDMGGSTRGAKRVCAGCVVRVDCLEDALERREPFGVWGGKSTKERDKIAAERRRAAGLPSEPPLTIEQDDEEVA
jgi:WhiB family redox-sensing transcriptional regulator